MPKLDFLSSRKSILTHIDSIEKSNDLNDVVNDNKSKNTNSEISKEKSNTSNCSCKNNDATVNEEMKTVNSNFEGNDCKIDVSNPFDLAKIDPAFEYKGYHKFSRILGRGSFGTVIECVRKKDDKLVALKLFKCKGIHKWIHESLVLNDLNEQIKKDSEFFSNEAVCNLNRLLPLEVACLARANKIENVVKLIDYIPPNDKSHITESCSPSMSCISENSVIGIVLERDPQEMSLFEYLLQNGCLKESEARLIIKQIIEASLELLNNGILHGDLKSENILIEPKTKRIKLIDFGSAQFLDSSLSNNNNQSAQTKHNNTGTNNNLNKYSFNKCKGQSLLTKPVRTFRGTNLYKPPEFILHHCFYPRPSTVWTFGIILFDMVCGHFPFDNDSDVLTHQDKEIEFKKPGLSDEFKDLIRRSLAFYVAERIVIEKLITHPWLNMMN